MQIVVCFYIIDNFRIENGWYSFYSLYVELAFHKYSAGKIERQDGPIVTLKFLEKYDKYKKLKVVWLK